MNDTCYIKTRNVTTADVPEEMPDDADASIVVDGVVRFATWYAGEYDLWGGNASIDHADTKVVLGNLDGVAKIALGPSANAITFAGVETGFIVEGTGDFRAGGTQSLKWNVTSSTLTIGEWIVSPSGLADNFTEANATIILDKTNARIQLGTSASAIVFAGVQSGFYVDGAGNLRAGGTQSLKWNVTTSTLTIGEWIISPNGLADNFTEANATILLDKTNARIQLGPSASAITFAGTETGLYIDGSGYFRVGGEQSLKWNVGTSTLMIGEWIVSPHGLADNWDEDLAKIVLDRSNTLIRVGPIASPYLIIDGDALNIRSSNYVSGIFGAGFSIDPDWLEVGNAHIRGIIRTAVFQKDVVSAVGGNLVILPADVLEADMTALDNGTF